MVGDRSGEDRGQVDVFRSEGTAGDLPEQPGFRKRHQSRRDADVNPQRLAIGTAGREAERLAPTHARAGSAGGRKLLHRRIGILLCEDGDEQTYRIDADGIPQRRRRDPKQDERGPPIALAGKRPEVAEPVRFDRLAHCTKLADEIIPQPAHFCRIAACQTR